MEIVKRTKNLGTLIIKPVDKRLAKELIVNNHYSHKWVSNFGIYNYGIFKEEEPDNCLGVASYGYMKNVNAKIFTHPNPNAWMIELNRMWIDDCLGHNAETILIGASLRLLKKENKDIVAVQSFADGRLGCGTIYKASNFRYYGFHRTKFLKNKHTGEVTHEQTFTDTTCCSSYLRANISYLIGDYETFQVKTYRYIYPFCKHFKFKGKEKPYPEYDKGVEPVKWVRDCTKIKSNIVYLLNKLETKNKLSD